MHQRVLLGILAFALTLTAAEYDILIRNARVIDGTGNPWFRADVGVRDGRIAGIGRLSGATAYRDIDAAGRVVAPGFIDVHTHVESTIEKVPRADNYITDGVTTIITGNCGRSRLSVAEWFTELERKGLGLNVASLIGHNTVRQEVMGDASRQATPEEIARMQALVDRAMRDGAVGFSTGLVYFPGRYANTTEVVEIAKAASKHGGVYATHMRNEGPKVLEAIDEAVTVGREAGMRVQLSHFKIHNRPLWGSSDKSIALVEKFRRAGVDVVVDQYPYDRSSANLSVTVPNWAKAGSDLKVTELLSDPSTRKRIIVEMLAMLRERGEEDYTYATVASFPPDRSYEGKTISDINALKKRPKTAEAEAETILELLSQGRALMVYHTMSEVDIEKILQYANTGIASDGNVAEFGVGVPHPRSYGTNARVLAEYVRKRGLITLEDAIRRMTSLPARTFRLQDRGLVQEGMVADLVMFDPARVQDKATYVAPHQYSEGLDLVLVNGQVAVENSKPTGILAGRVVRNR